MQTEENAHTPMLLLMLPLDPPLFRIPFQLIEVLFLLLQQALSDLHLLA